MNDIVVKTSWRSDIWTPSDYPCPTHNSESKPNSEEYEYENR